MRFTPLPPPFSSWHFTFIENIIQLRLPSMSLYNTAAASLSFTCFGNIYSLFDMWMGNSLIFMIGKTFPHTEKWKAIKVDERLNTWKKRRRKRMIRWKVIKLYRSTTFIDCVWYVFVIAFAPHPHLPKSSSMLLILIWWWWCGRR